MKTSLNISLSLLIASMAFAISIAIVTSSHGQDPGWQRPGTEEAAAVERANSEINRVYGQLTAKLDIDQQKSLKEAQRAWIMWRDKEAELIARLGGTVGGSAFRMDFLTAQAELIEQRTETLRGYLKAAGSNQ